MELDGAADDHLWVAAAPLPPYRAGSIVQWLIDFWYAPKFFLSSLTYLRRLLDSWPPIRIRFWFGFGFGFALLCWAWFLDFGAPWRLSRHLAHSCRG